VARRRAEDSLYAIVSSYIDRNGYAPSVRDLCEATRHNSTSLIRDYLLGLESRGLIRLGRDDCGKVLSRAIVLERRSNG
jgi:SOS-response transcriptional repressor LexA